MPDPAFIWTRPGHWLYQLWFRPKAGLERSLRAGGPFEQWRTRRARGAMRVAAGSLPAIPVRAPHHDEPCLVFLTGSRYWEQTAFCLRSLQVQTPGKMWPVIVVDDDTLQSHERSALEAAFPGMPVAGGARLRDALDATLPRGRFPALRSHRESFVLLRKLTDVHAARPGANLLLDADMLFHRRPDALLEWIENPAQPLVMTDCKESYGYDRARLSALTAAPLPPRVNTGVCGLVSARIDWDRMEHWTRLLLETRGSSYFLEQALVALLLSNSPHRFLSATDYVVGPSPREILAPRACLHHFVALTKRDYFRHAWRPYATATPGAPACLA